jgi:hypothetical protein
VKVSRRILLYGNSLILGSIGASLRRCPQFEVTTLKPPLQEAQAFNNVKPDILLFDLESPPTEAVFSLLKVNSTLLMVGINPDINLIQVWSGRQLRGMSMQSLIELLENTEKK